MRMENILECSLHCSGPMLTVQLSYHVNTGTSMLLNKKECIENMELSVDQEQANFLF